MGFLMETPFFSPQGNRYGSMNTMTILSKLQRHAARLAALLTPFGHHAATPRDAHTFSGAIFPSSPRSRWTFITAAPRPAPIRVAPVRHRKPEIHR
jgi:hypothetical protein